MMDFLYTRYGHLLSSFDQPWLSSANLTSFCDSVYRKGAALDNCWGFIDGRVRPVCRPGLNQGVLYNGHKRVHAIKFQSVVAPNGLIANLFGPVEGRRHECKSVRSKVVSIEVVSIDKSQFDRRQESVRLKTVTIA